MLTISDEALKMIIEKNEPVFLEMHKTLSNCCINLQECPAIRFGKPGNISDYDMKTIRDIPVYLPRHLPEHDLEIVVRSFLGIKRLVLKGWKVI